MGYGNTRTMTATDALGSLATRRLVHEVLALAETRDIVDAIHDLEHATAVLKERLLLPFKPLGLDSDGIKSERRTQ